MNTKFIADDMDIASSLREDLPIPIYVQIKIFLCNYIRDRNLQPGDKLPGLELIAASAKVSLKTAERALDLLVAEQICHRKPKKGTFVAAPSEMHKKVLLLFRDEAVFPPLDDLVFSKINKGIQQYCSKSNTGIIMCGKDASETMNRYRVMGSPFIGAVILPSRSYKTVCALSAEFPLIPLIAVHTEFSGADVLPGNVSCVFNDDFGGGFQLAAAFAPAARSFALCSLRSPEVNQIRRIEGFLHGLAERGVARGKFCVYEIIIEPDSCISIRKDDRSVMKTGKTCYSEGLTLPLSAGRLFAEYLHTSGNLPDAVLCASDAIAAGFMRYKTTVHLNSIAVAGYDNIVSEMSTADAYTTVYTKYEEMGCAAVKMLLKENEYPKIYRISPQLLLRE